MAKERIWGDILSSFENYKARYHRLYNKRIVFATLFFILAIVSIFVTLGFGVYKISVIDAIGAFFNHITDNVVSRKDDLYVWDIRLPAAIGGAVIGAGLALGGVVMQNLMHNPLAEPYTMGVSSGAFFGAVLFMICGISIVPFLEGETATIVNAFICSLIPIGIFVTISRFKKMSPTAMILIGIAMMYVFSSITQYFMVTSPAEDMASAYHWRVGSLSRIGWDELPIIVSIVAVTSTLLIAMYKKLDVMYSGDNCARTLGVNTSRLRITCMTLVSLMTAGIVCFTGTIGFIGLVGPHIARAFVGSKNKILIPGSMAFGAAFLVIADMIAKVSGINGLPVGVISSMVGGPLFLYVLIKQRKKVWN